MSARRVLPAVALLALLALAGLGAGLALVAPEPDEPARSGSASPEAVTSQAPAAPPASAPVASASPSGPVPSSSAASEPGASTDRVRLTGRLVAERLEWGWVQAVSAELKELERPPSEDDFDDVDDDEDGPDLTLDAEGVLAVDPWSSCDPEGAVIGRPVWSWAVPRGATRVDRSGAFALDLAPGTWVVLAGARGCSTRLERLRLDASRDVTWTLAHAAPATLALTCLAAGGEPLAHGRLECRLLREQVAPALVAVGEGPWGPLQVDGRLGSVERAELRYQVRLDANGRAQLDLPPGRVVLSDGGELDYPGVEVESSSLDPSPVRWDTAYLSTVDVTLAAGERREVTLRQPEPEGGAVVVRVRDAAGLPVAGAQVGLADTDDGPAFELIQSQGVATTGADGRATFLDRSFGATYVVARAGGRSGRSPPLVLQRVGERLEVEVVLDEVDPFGTLFVRVLAAETGAPVGHASVTPRLDEAGVCEERVVGPGLLRLDGIAVGRHRLTVMGPGRAAREMEVEVTRGAPRTVEVTLGPAAVVSGRITGSTGQEQVWLMTPQDDLVTSVTTDGAGAFRFDRGPAPGDELVVRVLGAYRFAYEVPVRAPAELEITLPAGQTTIQVVSADGAPAPGVHVFAHDARGRELVSGRTGQDGRLVLLGPPPPGGTVRAHGTPPAPLAPHVVLRRAAEPSREQAAPPGWTQVTGTALDAAGRPLVGARVWVHGRHGTHGTTTGADGAFDVRAAVGQGEVVVERADLGRWAQRLDVERGGARVTARLQPGVSVRVRAPAPAVTHVTFTPADGWGSERLGGSSSFRRADGAFDLGRLLPGRWEVVLRDDEWNEVTTRTIEVAPPGPLVVTLE